MVKELADQFEWIDVVDPGPEEIQRIAQQYNLHESSVNDCLQPDHLPKFELLDNYTFIIFRLHVPAANNEADTVQELTDTIALFVSKEAIISVRKNDWFKLDKFNAKTPFHLLNDIVKAGLLTYDEPATQLTRSIEHLEENIFLRQRKISLLRQMYFIKRKIDVMRRILILTHDIIDHIDSPQSGNTHTRDTRDAYIRVSTILDSLAENSSQLFNIYFSISAQKTNEIIRVLTLFSVFFMPLTFIVGIYGMNFHFMPELNWKLGYPVALLIMALVTLLIYWWFRKKGWL